jgi:hypothetical protein
MNVSMSSLSSLMRAQAAPRGEAAETPGMPDHDGDGDDGAASASTLRASATAPGVGKTVDVFA